MEGIRSYGPGKFYKIIDEYAYDMVLDGGADEEASFEEGGGWYGLLRLGSDGADRIREIAVEHDDEITRDEEKLLNSSAAVIFFERSDGIVEATWYDDALTAEQDWEEIESDVYGEEEENEDEEDE